MDVTRLYESDPHSFIAREVKPLVDGSTDNHVAEVDLDLEATLQFVSPNAAVTLDFCCFVWAKNEEGKAAERERIRKELQAVNTLVAEVLVFQRDFHEQAAKALEILE